MQHVLFEGPEDLAFTCPHCAELLPIGTGAGAHDCPACKRPLIARIITRQIHHTRRLEPGELRRLTDLEAHSERPGDPAQILDHIEDPRLRTQALDLSAIWRRAGVDARIRETRHALAGVLICFSLAAFFLIGALT